MTEKCETRGQRYAGTRLTACRGLAVGFLLARSAALAVSRGGWLLSAVVGSATGGMLGVVIFALGGSLICLLLEERRRVGDAGSGIYCVVGLVYAAAAAIQCWGLLHLSRPVAVLLSVGECAAVAAALGGSRRWTISALSAAVCAALTGVFAWAGVSCDGRLAAILINLAGAALAGATFYNARDGVRPVPAVAGMAAAVALDLFR